MQKTFGIKQLREGQEAVIARALAGADTLAIMPTSYPTASELQQAYDALAASVLERAATGPGEGASAATASIRPLKLEK